MWHLLRKLSGVNPEYREFIQDINQSLTRSITILLAAAWGLGASIAGSAHPDRYLGDILLTTPLVLLTGWLTLRLVEERPLWASVVWQVGMLLSATLGLALFQRAEIAILFAILPLTAAFMSGWPLALGSTLAVALVVGLTGLVPELFPINSTYRLLVIGGAWSCSRPRKTCCRPTASWRAFRTA